MIFLADLFLTVEVAEKMLERIGAILQDHPKSCKNDVCICIHTCIQKTPVRFCAYWWKGSCTEHSKQTKIKICKKTIKFGPKIDRIWSQNQSKLVQKSAKIGAKALLERSWGHLGPKLAQDHPKSSKNHFVGPPGTSILEAKIEQKSV